MFEQFGGIATSKIELFPATLCVSIHAATKVILPKQ
jgi:hypothetical protein